MPIFQTGRAPVAMRWIDPDGVELHIVAAYLGEHLVWDGTIPAAEEVPRMRGTGEVPVPIVSAAARVAVPTMPGAGGMPEPVPGGGGGALVPVMAGLGAAEVPVIGGGASIIAEPMDGAGEMHDPGVGTEVAGSAMVPTAVGTGSFPVPVVTVPGIVSAPVMTGTGQAPEVQVTAAAAIGAPVMAGTGQVPAPELSAGHAIAVPAAAGSGVLHTPTHAAGHAVPVPQIVGSGTLLEPTVLATPPQMIYSDDFNRATLGSLWNPINVTGGTVVPEISDSSFVRMAATTTNNQTNGGAAIYQRETTGDDQVVSADLVGGLAVNVCGLVLRSDAAGLNFVVAILTTGSDAWGIWARVNGSLTRQATFNTPAGSGDRVAFRVQGNRYEVAVNPGPDGGGGTVAGSWTDTGGVVWTGAGRRHGGVYVSSARNNLGTQSWSPGWDNWDLRDLRISGVVDAPAALGSGSMPVPSINEIPLLPMGMDKSGTLANGSSWHAVTGWTPRSGFPDTVITSNGLVANRPGEVTVYGKITVGGAGLIGPAVAFRIKRNGAVIFESPQAGATQSGSVTVTLAAGDVLTMESKSSSTYGSRTTQAGADNTYLYFE
ncbi:hypothetical protein F8M49_20700 [Rhodococcus zopfii]|uniref:Minor tail protein n=1 Tax=Rhodococcus zopfii TaxID=43772 RepID=A0ABU3WUX0_9NOCA|nr:hypothetical protein [Rhodococcus zopfii]